MKPPAFFRSHSIVIHNHPMRTKLLPAFIIAAGCLALGASAQTPAPAPVAEAPASLAPSRIIYAPRLPSVPELMNVAAAQGLGVERVDQTANQITVTYKSGGQLSTVVYNLLPGVATATTSAPAPEAPTLAQAPATVQVTAPVQQGTTVISTTPAPVVIYQQPETVYYRTAPYYYSDPYYPWGWVAPVALSVGFGYYWGDHYGYHGHGGYHGGGHNGGHGGHH